MSSLHVCVIYPVYLREDLDARFGLFLPGEAVEEVEDVDPHRGEGDNGDPYDDGGDETLLEALLDGGGLVRPRERLVRYRLVEELAQRLPPVLQVHLEQPFLGHHFFYVRVVSLEELYLVRQLFHVVRACPYGG